ncbi:MAG TPA: hypothetical protein VHF51_11715 [Solirubrobacteraceae bacterium]|nr:hypothetical protein [Solirubrobacteraceae bacterium]
MYLVLDHVILRSPDPAADLAMLEQAGLPLVVGVTHLAGTMHSGLVAAGSVDVEALKVGASPAGRVEGYGLGLRAPGTDQWRVARILRERGLRTSAPSAATVEHDGRPRRGAPSTSRVCCPSPSRCHSPTVHPVVESR